MEFSGRFILHLSSSLVAGVSENSPWPLGPATACRAPAKCQWNACRSAGQLLCCAAVASQQDGFCSSFRCLASSQLALAPTCLSLSLFVSPPSPLNLASSLEARTYFYCQRSVQLWTPAWSAACFRCRASGHQSSQYSVGVRRQFLGYGAWPYFSLRASSKYLMCFSCFN